MRREHQVHALVYNLIYPNPTPSDPPDFSIHLAKHLVSEVRIETQQFYGGLETVEARYPGLNYSHPPHRKRLSRFPHHNRLFKVFDQLGLTEYEIAALCRWEGTLWARTRYEKDEGIKVQDTTGLEILPCTERRPLKKRRSEGSQGNDGIKVKTDIEVEVSEIRSGMSSRATSRPRSPEHRVATPVPHQMDHQLRRDVAVSNASLPAVTSAFHTGLSYAQQMTAPFMPPSNTYSSPQPSSMRSYFTFDGSDTYGSQLRPFRHTTSHRREMMELQHANMRRQARAAGMASSAFPQQQRLQGVVAASIEETQSRSSPERQPISTVINRDSELRLQRAQSSDSVTQVTQVAAPAAVGSLLSAIVEPQQRQTGEKDTVAGEGREAHAGDGQQGLAE